jgi:hypothetical protein
VPPTSILSRHSHHIYHDNPSGLLPSALPRGPTRGRFARGYTPVDYPCPSSSPFANSRSSRLLRRTAHVPAPPSDGTCLIDVLPDDIILHILGFLEWEEILSTRPVSTRFAELALSPSLHQTLTLISLPPGPLPRVLSQYVLPNLRTLHLHLFPYPSPASNNRHPSSTLLALLRALRPDQLVSISLPYSAPYLANAELGEALRRIGGRLQRIDLRGSSVVGSRWLEWFDQIGNNGPGLSHLDLSFTSISSLPLEAKPDLLAPPMPASVFRNLTFLSLASCAGLRSSVIESFLAALPESLEYLDISRLEQATFSALHGMRVVCPSPEYESSADMSPALLRSYPTKLREIKVVGIDHLTKSNIRELKAHWESQRRACFPSLAPPPPPIPRVWGEPRTPEPTQHALAHPYMTPTSNPGEDRDSTLTSPPSSIGSSSSYSIATPSSARVMPWMSPASPDPYRSKLPNHPYLPSRSDPNAKPGSRESRLDTDEYDGISINIPNSAILESEDEEGYRRFIGEVAGATVGFGLGGPAIGLGLGTGFGTGLGMGLGMGMGNVLGSASDMSNLGVAFGQGWNTSIAVGAGGPVEVDGGGFM